MPPKNKFTQAQIVAAAVELTRQKGFDAVTARDYPLIQYAFLLSSLLTIAALLAADLCYKRIDPAMEVDDEQ